jgi:menaquinone-dependent protoporphyrinogen oxidase
LKTIIIYATKYGCTTKCVEILKTFLDGDTSIARAMDDNINLSEYDNVIIGGPVYMAKMHSKITSFCKRHKNQLLSKRLALFACCYTPSEDTEYLKKLFPKELLDHSSYTTTVGGIMNYEKMNFVYRKMFQTLKKIDDFNKNFIEPVIRTEDIKTIASVINKA